MSDDVRIDEELAPVIAALPAADRLRLAGGIVAIVAGQALIWLPEDLGVEQGFGLLLSALGAYALWLWYGERSPLTSPLLRALREAPGLVVWVYDRAVWRGSQQVGEIYVHLGDGTRCVLHTKTVADAAPLLAVLRRRAPHARFGWDAETERQFSARPSSVGLRAA
jgi:hypothetical protein